MKQRLIILVLTLSAAAYLQINCKMMPFSQPAGAQQAIQARLQQAKLMAKFEKDRYFLGENVLVRFTLQNDGDKPLQIDTGSDYRGAPRSMRYYVRVTASDGSDCADPFPDATHEGGLGGSTFLKKGETFTCSLPLMRYARIDRPGKYKVAISHDFGWNLPKESVPTASAEVTFDMPSAEEAKAVVQKMLALPHDPVSITGNETADYQDFGTLSFPVYLPSLKELALKEAETGTKSEDFPAIDGISGIGTIEASTVLLELGQSKNAALALKAVQSLNLRLPDPTWKGLPGGRNPFENPINNQRKRLNQLAWNASFEPKLREIAKRFIGSKDVPTVQCGAFILQCIGTSQDVGSLTLALNESTERIKTLQPEPNYPRPRGAMQELLRSALMLVKRGAAIPEALHSSGEKILFLIALGNSNSFRPAAWQSTAVGLLRDEHPIIRELALQSIPGPFTESMKVELSKLLTDKDPDVRIAALQVLEREPDPQFNAALLAQVRQSSDFISLHQSIEVARKAGLNFDVLKIVAERLDEPPKSTDISFALFDYLVCACIELPQNISMMSQTTPDFTKIKANWLQLISENEALFRADKKLSITDPAVKTTLFPLDFQVQLKNGEKFPKNNESAESALRSLRSSIDRASMMFGVDQTEGQKQTSLCLERFKQLSGYAGFNEEMRDTAGDFESGKDRKPKVSVYANELFVKALSLMADYYFESADYERAAVLYGQSITSRSNSEDHSFALAKGPASPAVVVESLNSALTKNGNDYSGRIQDIVQDVVRLAQTYDLRKRFSEADELYKCAIPHVKSTDFRHVSADSKNVPAIETRYLNVLNSASQVVGQASPLVATRCELMARFYQQDSNPVKAEDYYRKAIHIRTATEKLKADGSQTKMLCFDLQNLKDILSSQNRTAEAQALNGKLLELNQKESPDAPATARLLLEQADNAVNEGKKEKALDLYKRLWQIEMTSASGMKLMQPAYILSRMIDLGTTANDAVDLAGRAAALKTRGELESNYHSYLESIENIAYKLQTFGKTALAEKLLKDELSWQKQRGKVRSVYSILLLHRLADIYQKSNRNALAEQSLREIFRIAGNSPSKLTETTGLQLPDPMTSLYELLLKEKRYAEALPLIKRRLNIARETDGARSISCAWILEDLASCYRAQGSMRKADEILKESKEIEAQSGDNTVPPFRKGELRKPSLIAYLDLHGSRGFDCLIDVADDGSSIFLYDVLRHADFDQTRYRAQMEFWRAVRCEGKALTQKNKGHNAVYANMHKQTVAAATNALSELQKLLNKQATDKNDEEKHHIADLYMDMAYCHALMNSTDQASHLLDKYFSCLNPEYSKSNDTVRSSKRCLRDPGYFLTVASIMLAEGDLNPAKKILETNLSRLARKGVLGETSDVDERLTARLMLVEIGLLQNDKILAKSNATEARALRRTVSERTINSAKHHIEAQLELSFDDLLAVK